MGKRGKQPLTADELMRRGSWRAKSRAKTELHLPEDTPEPPSWLRPEALDAWKNIIPEVAQGGHLTQSDQLALAGLCQTVAKWRICEEFLAKYGDTQRVVIRDSQGNKTVAVRQFPQAALSIKLWESILRMCQHFGLTPSARVGMAIHKPEKPANPLTEFAAKLAEIKKKRAAAGPCD